MDLIALGLPCLARRREHGGLASAGITDNGRDPLRPGDMLDRPALLVRKSRRLDLAFTFAGVQLAPRNLPGRVMGNARPNGGVLGIYRPLDMPAIDAMTMSRVHPLRALDHAGFDLDHFAGGIASKLDLARCRVRALGLQLDQRRRGHHLRKGALELLRVVVDVAMQRPRNVVAIEHALFPGDEG